MKQIPNFVNRYSITKDGRVWSHLRNKFLYLGTHRADKRGLRKYVSGEKHGKSKLTDEEVRKIRKMKNEGYTLKKLGDLFSTHYSNIGYIVNFQTRKHV